MKLKWWSQKNDANEHGNKDENRPLEEMKKKTSIYNTEAGRPVSALQLPVVV